MTAALGNLKTARVKACKQCGKEFLAFWARQTVCTPCKPSRGVAAAGCGVAAYQRSRSAAITRIASERGKQVTSLLDIAGQPHYIWSLTYSVPFSLDALKNRRWSNTGHGTVFLTESVRRYSDLVVHQTKRALEGRQVRNNKLWLSFYVEKPNHKIDAINVVDTLCDAIKVAVGLDDKWFCLGKVDWCIKKSDQNIIISVAQESDEDVLVCSHCGDIKAPDTFKRDKNGPLGRSRVCLDCSAILNEEARLARARA